MLKGITQHGLLPILGLAFKLGLFVVTAINTYAILLLISQDRVWAAAGLILFEVGLLYWWLVFKNDNDSSVIQMSISILMFVTCLILVGAANALHLGAVSPDLLGSGTIAKVVIMAVFAHLSASLIYPLASQEHMAALVERIAIGLVWAKAQGNVMANLDGLAEQTQAEIEDRMWRTIQGGINRTADARLVNGDGVRPIVIEGQSTPVPARPAHRPRRSLMGRLFRQPEPQTADVSNTTHNDVHHESTPATRPAGQGEPPRLHPDDLAALAAVLSAQRTPVATPSANGQEPKNANP